MRSPRRRLLDAVVVLAVPVVALTGCTLFSHQSSSTPSLSSAPETPTTSSRPPLPPRPNAMPLDGINPCSVLTSTQRKQFGFDRPPIRGTDASMSSAPICDLRDSVGALSARIGLVTSQGIDIWEDETAQNETRRTLVTGFPALVVRSDNRAGFCNVEVDVADGQFLDVMYGNAGSSTPPSFDNLCLKAQQVAAAAMASLANRS
jgi:hypothetical protein